MSEVQYRAGEGILLFMIHGQGIDHRLLLALEPALEQCGIFERIYIDLPGMGSSPALDGEGSLQEYAQWLEARIASIAAGRKFALLGNSMGGLLAQHIADRFPGRILGLALLASVVYPQQAQRSLPARQIAHTDEHLFSKLDAQDTIAYKEMSVVQTEENWLAFQRFALPGIRSANLRALARLGKRYVLEPLPVHGTRVEDFPTLILCGTLDHICGFDDQLALLRRYQQADYQVIERAGHNLHLDAPQQVHQALLDWAQKVAGYAGQPH